MKITKLFSAKRAGLLAGAVMLAALAGCSQKKDDGCLLYLDFNENTGTLAADQAGGQEKAEVNYLLTHSVYTESRDPQWRSTGISGGSLLFDGCSTYLGYAPDSLCVQGDSFSISVWVAPRAFEWDSPEAADAGDAHLTSIVSQYSKQEKQGFLLGYQRYGKLCFEAGTGEEWFTLWGENLNKYEWNQVTAVFDGKGGEMRLYQNGKLTASKDIPSKASIAPAKNERLLVGKNSHADQIAAGTYNMFSGLMDELKLYKKVVKEEELAKETAPEIAFEDIWLENVLTEDIYKTQYHGGPYQHWMNEPHGPVYYNGKYHLFYQCNMVGTYWRNICWGHLVSDDMVSWTPIKEAITPQENSVAPDGIWSGGAALDVNGVPLLFFTAGNDSFRKSGDGLISNQNIGVAYPADLSDPNLTDWIICDELAVKQEEGQGRAGEFRDSHIWKEGDSWNMLICSGSAFTDGGTALLYRSDTLELTADGTIDMDWKYIGPIYEMENQSVTYGTSWELPILLPLTNEAGTITKYIFMFSPAPAGIADNKVYYYLGEFDSENGKFTPEEDGLPKLLDYGCNVFTGPSAMVDPVSGEVCLFSIMQDQRNGAEEGSSGWAHCVGLTRRIWLNDDGTDVNIAPIDALHKLEGEVLAEGEHLTLEEANSELGRVSGDLLYVRAEISPENSAKFGIRIKKGGARDESSFTYDVEYAEIICDTKNKGSVASSNHMTGALELRDGKLTMEIYIDRSLVEAFFNDSKAISLRSYSEYDSQGMEFFADGEIMVESLYVAEMKSIFK